MLTIPPAFRGRGDKGGRELQLRCTTTAECVAALPCYVARGCSSSTRSSLVTDSVRATNRADSRARAVVGGQCVDVDDVKPDASAWSWAIRSELFDMTAHHRHAARRLNYNDDGDH